MNKDEFKKTLQGVYGYKYDLVVDYCEIQKYRNNPWKTLYCNIGVYGKFVGLFERDHAWEVIDDRLVITFRHDPNRKVGYILGKNIPSNELHILMQRINKSESSNV